MMYIDLEGFQLLLKHLESIGFRRLSKDTMAGGYAVVAAANSNLMIRIATKNSSGLPEQYREPPRPDSPDVLQPIVSTTVAGYWIEILPKVHTLKQLIDFSDVAKEYGISEVADAESLVRSFISQLVRDNLQRGKLFFDPSFSNIAIIKDKNKKNVPIILDPGAVVDVDKATNAQKLEFGRRCYNTKCVPNLKKSFPEIGNAFDDSGYVLPEFESEICRVGQFCIDHFNSLPKIPAAEKIDYEAAQDAHLASRGLEKGKIKGVLDDKQLENAFDNFETERTLQQGNSSAALYPQALISGVSPGEFQEANRAVVAGEHFSKDHINLLPEGEKRQREDVPLSEQRPGFCHRIRQHLVEQHGVGRLKSR
ncbi:MAG: hypothetical protein EBR02_00355 [Alphaproteobacteria bacterium]|nr:hypothetical protein [Alphaproteobacteria bacterium]